MRYEKLEKIATACTTIIIRRYLFFFFFFSKMSEKLIFDIKIQTLILSVYYHILFLFKILKLLISNNHFVPTPRNIFVKYSRYYE